VTPSWSSSVAPSSSRAPATGRSSRSSARREWGKSRLVHEFIHSHRLQGWLVLESASVSYGKATSYVPVIDLLKGYFEIHDRDDLREIRAKVTGKLLTLDEALKPILPALLTLLDVPVDDVAWQTLDSAQRRQLTLDGVKQLLLREAREQPLLLIFEDLHWIDGETQALLDSLVAAWDRRACCYS
jgi:predicted ATPase